MAFKRETQGIIVKIAGEKTASILVEGKVAHPRYRKIVKRFKKYLIYDERNEVKVGGIVVAAECRPLSRRESSRLKSVLVTGVR